MSNWTKGPWRIANGTQIRSDRDQIARVNMIRNGEGKANANLISAAPDLANSTQWLLDTVHALLSSKPVRDMDERISFAESALRKARGE